MSRQKSWLIPYRCGWYEQLQTDPEGSLMSNIEKAEITLDYYIIGTQETQDFMTMEHVITQHDTLNRAFAAENADALNSVVEEDYQAVAAPKTRIEFLIGDVTRVNVESSLPSSHVRSLIRALKRPRFIDGFPDGVPLDTTRISILITDGITLEKPPLSQSVLPNLTNSRFPEHAVMMATIVFGDYTDPRLSSIRPDPPVPSYMSGNTMVHELAHGLGLFHPFHNGCALESASGGGGGCPSSSSSFSDQIINHYISDCPPGSGPLFSLLSDENPRPASCADPSKSLMQSNFMEYNTEGNKIAAFTVQQAAMMHYVIDKSSTGEINSALKDIVQITRYADGQPRPFETFAFSTRGLLACLSEPDRESGLDMMCACAAAERNNLKERAAGGGTEKQSGQSVVVPNGTTVEEMIISLVDVLAASLIDFIKRVRDGEVFDLTQEELVEMGISEDQINNIFEDDYFSAVHSSSGIRLEGKEVVQYAEEYYDCFIRLFTMEVNLEIEDLIFFVEVFDDLDLFAVVNRIICQCSVRLDGEVEEVTSNSTADWPCFAPQVEGNFDEELLATFYPEFDYYILWIWSEDDEEWTVFEGEETGDIAFAQFPNDEDVPAVGYYFIVNENGDGPNTWIELVDAIEDGLIDEDDVPEQSRRFVDVSLLKKNRQWNKLQNGRKRLRSQKHHKQSRK